MKRHRLTIVLLVIVMALFSLRIRRSLRRPQYFGIPISLVHHCGLEEAFKKLGDDRQVIVQARLDGNYRFNETPIRASQAAHEINLIYSTRNERLVWFIADPKMTYGEALGALAQLNTTGYDVRVAVPTPKQVLDSKQPINGEVVMDCPE